VLRKILLIVVAVLVLFAIIGMLLPRNTRVARSVTKCTKPPKARAPASRAAACAAGT
jgi:hypothetical protein